PRSARSTRTRRRARTARCLDRAPPPDCFFFSSRRRHTRWPRDWSSDVCSSDLVVVGLTQVAPQQPNDDVLPAWQKERRKELWGKSEERRVGKEGKSGWRLDH